MEGVTTKENYLTAGSSIFCKLYLRVFDFLTFILQGPQFCKNYTLGLSKIGFFNTLGLGVRPKILNPRHFYWKSPGGLLPSLSFFYGFRLCFLISFFGFRLRFLISFFCFRLCCLISFFGFASVLSRCYVFFLVTRLLSFLNSVCSSLSLFLLATVPLPFPIGNAQFSLDSRFASQSRFKCVCIYQCGFSFLFLYLLVSSVDAIFQYVLVISINALFPI